jgi:outer membrane protein OmpA-like peptidoglycan-associated protein
LPGEKKAYFSSDRFGGKGDYDIYQLQLPVDKPIAELVAEMQPVPEPEPEPEPEIVEVIDTIPVDTTPAPVVRLVTVEGTVIDNLTQRSLPATIEVFLPGATVPSFTLTTDPQDGRYVLTLPDTAKWEVRVQAEGYLGTEKLLEPAKQKSDFQFIIFDLFPNREKQETVLENVLFRFGSSELDPSSFASLDQLLAILKVNSGLRIEIAGHTDNVGSDVFNQRLSQRRAEAVRDYLVRKGIRIERLEAVGYGSAKPIASNDTTEGRDKNRRVTFTILANE